MNTFPECIRVRTIEEAANYYKTKDPDTALTPTAIRRLVVSGVIPSTRIGAKYLVNLAALDRFLSGESEEGGGVNGMGAGT